jgi:tetratricopeptide (TPR) repeat protein
MNRIQQLAILSMVASFLIGCGGGIDMEQEWQLYKKAKARNDFSTAAFAVNRILLADESQEFAYDSLATLYYVAGMDRSAAITADQGLEKHESETLIEISANARKNLGDTPGSLQAFLRLLEMRPGDLLVPYEIAFAYINMEQYDQAMRYIDLVVAHDQAATTNMTEFVNKGQQQVPFKAVALNMRGFVHMQNQRYQEAADAYQGALQVFPDYQLAQNNLRFLVAQLEAASE